jgi:FPC/CPF motif-containing protein YcgG
MSNDLWRSRVIGTPVSAGAGWESSAYEDYRQRVLQSDYPCFFGQRAEQLGEIFYAFVSRENPASIVAAMSAFSDALGSERFARFSLIAFFETGRLPDHAAFAAHFWAALQRLSDSDGGACDMIRSTDDPLGNSLSAASKCSSSACRIPTLFAEADISARAWR